MIYKTSINHCKQISLKEITLNAFQTPKCFKANANKSKPL